MVGYNEICRSKPHPTESGTGVVKANSVPLPVMKWQMGVPEETIIDELSPARLDPVEMPGDATNSGVAPEIELVSPIAETGPVRDIITTDGQFSFRGIIFPASSKPFKARQIHPVIGGISVQKEVPPQDEEVGMHGQFPYFGETSCEAWKAIVIPGNEVDLEIWKFRDQFREPGNSERNRFVVGTQGPAKIEGVSIENKDVSLVEERVDFLETGYSAGTP